VSERRQRQLAAIHIAAKQLGLDEDTYRAALWTVGRVRSAAELDEAGRRRMLDHLRGRGTPRYPGKPRRPSADCEALMGKIEALLADMRLPWSYARAICARQTRHGRLEWCRPDELHKIVASLSYEQEKRSLLATIRRLLAQLGLDERYVDELLCGRPWKRNIQRLRAVAAHLGVKADMEGAS